MKTRIKTIIIISALVLSSSCEKWMDLIPPEGLIRQEFWKTKEDVEAVLMGAYETFSRMDRKLWLAGELRGDMIEGDYNQGWNEKSIQEGDVYSDNWFCNWQEFYTVINYCNEIIANAPDVKEIDNTFTDYLLQGYLSEAYFLRGLAYFYLVRLYKDVPYVTEPTVSDDTEFYLPKTNGDTILNYLLDDLEEYRKYATTDGFQTIEQIKGRATKAAFDALMADINLWIFDYEEVIRHVEKIEANPDFELMPTDKWFELFYPGNSLESIFEFQFNTENNQNNSLYGLTNYNGHNYDPSITALELLSREYAINEVEEKRGEDISIRKEGEDDYIIWKYVGRVPDGETTRESSESQSANLILYRLADIYLMKAEALSQLGRLAEATYYIQEIQDRAGVPKVTLETVSQAEDIILEERAIELAFEGKRWFDLMRMGRRNNFAKKDILIEIIVKNIPSTQKRIKAKKLSNPLGWYLPILEQELERNKALVQNPYYNF